MGMDVLLFPARVIPSKINDEIPKPFYGIRFVAELDFSWLRTKLLT